jgi:hypothetical protein
MSQRYMDLVYCSQCHKNTHLGMGEPLPTMLHNSYHPDRQPAPLVTPDSKSLLDKPLQHPYHRNVPPGPNMKTEGWWY